MDVVILVFNFVYPIKIFDKDCLCVCVFVCVCVSVRVCVCLCMCVYDKDLLMDLKG